MNQLEMFGKLETLQAEFKHNIDNCIKEHKPSKVLVSYSGGHDSAVVLHLMLKLDVKFDVFTIDTGLSTHNHLSEILKTVNSLGLKLWIYEGGGYEWYEKNVQEFGFAYTPNQHAVYYQNLKRDAINVFIRDFKQHYHDRIMFVTGVRRLESVKRANTPIIYRKGARVSCNAIATFTDNDKNIVMKDCSWWQGRKSHDCLCNWHCKYNTDYIVKNSIVGNDIVNLSADMITQGLWGYGEKPDKSFFQDDEPLTTPMDEDSYCINCYSKTLFG